MSDTFRLGIPRDSAAILETVCDAFEVRPDHLRYPAHRALANDAPHEFRVLERAGRIVAVAHIGDTWIQVGRCAVLKGDVGHVAVRTELQGQGVGTLLMRDTIRWLRDNGYHLSRLGGLMLFYSRFGYEPFLRRFVEFRVEQVQGGKKLVPPTEAHPAPTGYPGLLRPFDESRDWQARAEIAYAFYHGRSGAPRVSRDAHPPSAPVPPDPQLLRFTYELDGQVKGYLLATDSPLESRPDEPCFSVYDFAYLPDCPQAAGLLFRLLLSRIAPRAPALITSRLPFDEHLAVALQSAGVSFQRIEMHQTVAGNMIQVLNLGSTLREILPELTARFAQSLVADWTGAIELALPGQTSRLRLAGGAVTQTDAQVSETDVQVSDLRFELTQADFVKLLFGIVGFGELRLGWPDLDRRQLAVMASLFPRCPAGSGPWG